MTHSDPGRPLRIAILLGILVSCLGFMTAPGCKVVGIADPEVRLTVTDVVGAFQNVYDLVENSTESADAWLEIAGLYLAPLLQREGDKALSDLDAEKVRRALTAIVELRAELKTDPVPVPYIRQRAKSLQALVRGLSLYNNSVGLAELTRTLENRNDAAENVPSGTD